MTHELEGTFGQLGFLLHHIKIPEGDISLYNLSPVNKYTIEQK